MFAGQLIPCSRGTRPAHLIAITGPLQPSTGNFLHELARHATAHTFPSTLNALRTA